MSSQPTVSPAAGSATTTTSSAQPSGGMLEAFLYDTTSSIQEKLLFSPSSGCSACVVAESVARAEAAILSFDTAMASDSKHS